MKTYAIVPVKDLDRAKSRLADCLSPELRRGLLLAMLKDVLGALQHLTTLVISPRDMSDLVSGRNVVFLKQKGVMDLNSAVKQANEFALEDDADATLFVPADMPLISPMDVENIIHLGKTHRAIITQSMDGGTGILFRRPPDIMEGRFTKNSFLDHNLEAKEKGIELYVHKSFSLSLDIDKQDDLKLLMKTGKSTCTYDYLIHENIFVK